MISLKEAMEKYKSKCDELAELKRLTKFVEGERDDFAIIIRTLLEDQGLDQVKTEIGTFTVKPDLLPQIKDMEELMKWCVESDNMQMIQKRPSKTAVNEFFDNNGAYPPGIDCFVTSKLHFKAK